MWLVLATKPHIRGFFVYSLPHSRAFLFNKWFNFHYRYTGKVSFIEDFQPALGAGGREFESLHPDRREYHSSLIKPSRNRGLSFYHIYSLLFINSHKGDTELWDTLFQFNKLNEKKVNQPRKGRGRVRYIRGTHIVGYLFVDR